MGILHPISHNILTLFYLIVHKKIEFVKHYVCIFLHTFGSHQNRSFDIVRKLISPFHRRCLFGRNETLKKTPQENTEVSHMRTVILWKP